MKSVNNDEERAPLVTTSTKRFGAFDTDDQAGDGETCNMGEKSFCRHVVPNVTADVIHSARKKNSANAKFNDFFGPAMRRETEFFDWGVFAFEFLTHRLYPISLPVILWVQGATAGRNKGLLPGHKKNWSFWRSTVLYNMFLAAPFIFVIAMKQWWLTLALIVLAITDTFRILVIAGKYACYCPHEYELLLTSDEYDISERLLLAVWGQNIPSATLDDELFYSQWANKLSVHLGDLHLTLLDGTHAPCADYLREVVDKTFGKPVAPKTVTFLTRLFGLLLLLTPLAQWAILYAGRGDLADQFGNNESFHRNATVWNVIGAILVGIPIGMQMFSVLWFQVCGVLHFFRHLRCRQALINALIFSPDAQVGRVAVPDGRMVPLLGHTTNLLNWTAVLWTAQAIGTRYERRINFNGVAVAIVNGLLLLLLVYKAFIDQRREPVLIFVVALLYISLTLSVLMAAYFAARANDTADKITTLLTQEEFVHVMSSHQRRHERRTRRLSRAPSMDDDEHFGAMLVKAASMHVGPAVGPTTGGVFDPDSDNRLSDSDSDSEAARELVELREHLELTRGLVERTVGSTPHRVLYMPASSELLTLIASLLISGCIVLFAIVSTSYGEKWGS